MSSETTKHEEHTVEMTVHELRVLLDLFMVSDPWPLEDAGHRLMEAMLDRESLARGHENWVVAYHEMPS